MEIINIMKKRWTHEEVEFLRENINVLGVALCGQKLNRTISSIRTFANRNNMFLRIWRENEIQFLKENYYKIGAKKCSEFLKRSIASILCQIVRLKRNKIIIAPSLKEVLEKSKENHKKWQRQYHKKKQGIDNQYTLSRRIRSSIKNALNGKCKRKKTQNIIGCSKEFFIDYLKSKFTKNMKWENFLNGEIHIDHIKPCVSFDLTDQVEVGKCCHYSNLQPLWATTKIAKKYGDFDSIGNLNKGDKI